MQLEPAGFEPAIARERQYQRLAFGVAPKRKVARARRVDVVGVLMGDHDRGQPGDAFEAMREISRVEQQGGVAEVGEYTGMAKMRELHVYDCALMGCLACA